MFIADVILRWMHILGAITLVGGTYYMRFVLLPAMHVLSNQNQKEVNSALRFRWARLTMAATALLLISGVVNTGLIASRYDFESPLYHMLLGVKFLLALPIFYIAARLAGRSESAEQFREKARFWLTVNVILATIVVGMAGVMRLTSRLPKQRVAGQNVPATGAPDVSARPGVTVRTPPAVAIARSAP